VDWLIKFAQKIEAKPVISRDDLGIPYQFHHDQSLRFSVCCA
jgi:hypothetical protein